MALFDYQCPKCKRTVERIVRGSEELKVRCHTCDVLMEKQMPVIATPQCFGEGIYKPSSRS